MSDKRYFYFDEALSSWILMNDADVEALGGIIDIPGLLDFDGEKLAR